MSLKLSCDLKNTYLLTFREKRKEVKEGEGADSLDPGDTGGRGAVRGSSKHHMVRSGLGGMILFLASKTSKRSFHQPIFLIPTHAAVTPHKRRKNEVALGGAERNQEICADGVTFGQSFSSLSLRG